MPITFRLHHVTITVKNLQQSIDFYQAFGFLVVTHWKHPENTFHMVQLKQDDTFIELFWFKEQKLAPYYAADRHLDNPHIGIKHLALHTNSIIEAKAFVENQGFASNIQITDGKMGFKYFFITDPNGVQLEFVQDTRSF